MAVAMGWPPVHSGHSFGDAVEGHLSSLAVTLAVLTHAGLTDN